MRDILSNLQYVRGANQTLSGTTANASEAIDRRGFDALSVILMTGAVTDAGAAAGFTMKLQHSDTLVGTEFVDVTADEMVNGIQTLTVTSDDDDSIAVGAVGYLGGKRYVRAVITGTADTDAVVYVIGALGKPHRAPVAAIGATVATT
jgi:hypothetical protein